MADTFPNEAKSKALKLLMPLSKATTKATSELKGKIVAAKKAEKNKAISAMKYSPQQKL